MGYITFNPSRENSMTYAIRKQDTITTNYGVYWGDTLLEGGFLHRSDAWDALEWFQTYHPNGPKKVHVIAGWWF